MSRSHPGPLILGSLADDITDFRIDRRARNLSPATIRFYQYQLSCFARCVGARGIGETAGITPAMIRAYIMDHSNGHKPGGTMATYRAVRAFFRWWADEYDLPRSPIAKVRPPRASTEPLAPISLEDFQALLRTCSSRGHTDG